MCVTCGCSDTEKITVTNPATGETMFVSHDDAHTHGHSHDHHHEHSHGTAAVTAKVHVNTIELEKEILGKNQLIAERNRGWFAGRNILALNLVN